MGAGTAPMREAPTPLGGYGGVQRPHFIMNEEALSLETYTVFSITEELYNTSLVVNSAVSDHVYTPNHEQQSTPWNKNAIIPTIKNIDTNYHVYSDEDIIIANNDITTILLDTPRDGIALKVINKHPQSQNYFRNTKNLKSVSCMYRFEKDFFVILEKNYHIIPANNEWLFIRMHFSSNNQK
jgi:hypothetical protein